MRIFEMGDSGPEVREIQKALTALGLLKTDRTFFDVPTDWAVKRFQREQGLVEDGLVGPKTWAALFPTEGLAGEGVSEFAEAFARVALGDVGVHEQGGANRGPQIDAWTKELGLPLGLPWCMIAVQHWARLAAVACGIKDDPLKPDTGGVLDLWNRVPRSWRVDKRSGRRGDIIIFDHGHGNGHCGVTTGGGGDTYSTVEGNTNDDGSRDGYEVCQKRHSSSDPKLLGFLRIPV